jgi:hypothetical protein
MLKLISIIAVLALSSNVYAWKFNLKQPIRFKSNEGMAKNQGHKLNKIFTGIIAASSLILNPLDIQSNTKDPGVFIGRSTSSADSRLNAPSAAGTRVNR